MTFLPQLQWVALCMVVAMAWGWAWQRRHANAGIVDVIWTLGIGASAVFIAATGVGAAAPRRALACAAAIWSLRLALHLWRRVRHTEDGRYKSLRGHWQGNQAKFFGLFMCQAVLVVIFSLPFLAVAENPSDGVHVWIGLAIWAIALTGEAISDRQLHRFVANPKNHGYTCRKGLWRYSRHPNYFFEWCHWFCYCAMAWGGPHAWLTWVGPVLMYIFLRWVSGIPHTEKQALRSRGDEYRSYQQSTSAFFPWFPHEAGDKQ